MNVTASTRRKALLGIYRIRRKRKGGRLAARELERAWTPTTGLRASDLRRALDDMTQQQLLVQGESAHGAIYELTYVGERAMHALLGDQPVQSIRDWITLLRARMRREGKRSSPRRAGDTAAAH